MFIFAFRRSVMARAALSPRDRLIEAMREKRLQQKGMLRDPAVYPLIAIVGTALTLASGFMIYFSFSRPDVRLNRRERQKLMREMARQDKVARLDDPYGKG